MHGLADIATEMRRFSELIDKGIGAISTETRKMAEAERSYRHGKAEAWVMVREELPGSTAKEREAWVDSTTADLRFERDVAEGMRQAALEAVRSRRAQLSALQTLANAHQAEAEFARTAPR